MGQVLSGFDGDKPSRSGARAARAVRFAQRAFALNPISLGYTVDIRQIYQFYPLETGAS